jgi:glyoxylase-like metal-dependent hydrolase (beta-lactamase superfamily II)
MEELPGGIRRVTLPLPNRPGHVHAYVLPGDDGWTVVDTGLGLPDARERWAAELATLDGAPVRRIVVTHFHPDHVGAAADLAELTGA